MSSFSSIMSSGSNNTVHAFSMDQFVNYAKNYICPKCNKPYDFQMAGSNFIGKVPLILNCKHSICQECVYKMYPSKNIICGECHTSNFITDLEAKKKADQVFIVNYYVLGVLTYYKRYGCDMSNVNFKPAGYHFKNSRDRNKEDFKPSSFLNFNTTASQPSSLKSLCVKVEEPLYVCCRENCKKEAKVNCTDCDEMFCKDCSDNLHNVAKGLKKHKVSPISANDQLELTEGCLVHSNALVEFCCETCQQNLCCYCILGGHNGHTFYQMTTLDEKDVQEFNSLVDDAENVLKRLVISEKKAKSLLNKGPKGSNDNSIELSISKEIENAIAKLQFLEKNLLAEAQVYKNQDRICLMGVLENLSLNIRTVSDLISNARQASNQQGPRKLNMKLLKKQLEEVSSNTACYFLQSTERKDSDIEFLFEKSLIDDLQDSTKLKYLKTNLFSLVARPELPVNYEEDDVDMESLSKSLLSSASSLIGSADKVNEDLKFKKATKQDTIEKWIKSNTDVGSKNFKAQREQDVAEIPILKKGDRETVRVTHLASPECFYVQLLRLSGPLNRLSKHIERYVKNPTAARVQNPETNSIYLIKYMSDGNIHWCRGRIVEENSAQKMYGVFFIDYGNTGNVRKEDMLMIPPDLKKHPPFAIECKFFDLYPVKGEWDPKVLVLITRIIANNELLMIVSDRLTHVLEVDLITMDCDTSVRDALKFLGYGIPYCKYPTELDKIKKELKNAEGVKLYNKIEKFKKEDTMDVIISYVIDPHNVYINMKNSKQNLTKMHENMRNFYTENKKGFVYTPKENMVVAVLYSDGISSSWRRGIITESMEGRAMVNARLVDIGMVISVSWDQIRKLDSRFVPLDCQAKLVKMAHIAPCNGVELWSQNAIDYFTEHIKSETVLKMVVSDATYPPEVVLFECLPAVQICLNAKLVKKNLAESTGDLSLTVEWPLVSYREKSDDTFTISMMKTIQATNHHQPSTTKDTDSGEEEYDSIWRKPVEIISVESPDLIYVKFPEDKDKQHEFQLELRHFYLQNKLAPADWEVGRVCVVNYKKQYYRGIILEIRNNHKYLVCLRDIAATAEVKERQLGVLNSRFMKIPEFAIRCHLADITPAGGTKKWSAMACEFLQDVLKKNNKLFLARKGELDRQRKSMPVIIWYVEILPGSALESSETVLHSVNKLLLKNGLALKTVIKRPIRTQDKNEGAIKKDNEKILPEKTEHEELDVKKETQEDDRDEDSVKSLSTETEDHECSSSASSSSVAGALKPSKSSRIDWNDLIEMQKQCPEQIIRDWVMPLAFKSDHFVAIPTFVNDDGEIFLHDIELEPMLKDMEEKMFEYFNSRGEIETGNFWTPGEMCSVRYFVNKKWYRGKISRVNGPSIKVIMVDYGNEDECDPKDLSKEILYYDLPIFANKVVLHDVYPKEDKWLVSDLDLLHGQIVDKRVTVTLKSQQIIGLSTPAAIQLDTVNINDFILKRSTNLSRIHRPRRSVSKAMDSLNDSIMDNLYDQSDNDVIIEEAGSSSDETDMREDIDFNSITLNYKQEPLPNLEPKEKFKIVVINVLDFNKIIFEMPCLDSFEKGRKLFENMSKDISTLAGEQPLLKSFEIGKACVSVYANDWYRAQIIKELDEKVCVWFVDFGNFDNVSKNLLRESKDEWLNHPVDHYLATIDGIALTDQNNVREVLTDVLSYCGTAKMARIISRNPLRIQLFKEDTNTLAYENLLDSGLLKLVEIEQITDEGKKDKEQEVLQDKKIDVSE